MLNLLFFFLLISSPRGAETVEIANSPSVVYPLDDTAIIIAGKHFGWPAAPRVERRVFCESADAAHDLIDAMSAVVVGEEVEAADIPCRMEEGVFTALSVGNGRLLPANPANERELINIEFVEVRVSTTDGNGLNGICLVAAEFRFEPAVFGEWYPNGV